MKVICTAIKVEDFPYNSDEHLAFYRRRLRGSNLERGFDDLVIGNEYVVYAVKISGGYPLYFVKTSEPPFLDYCLRPGPCFEIVDNRLSKYWVYNTRIYEGAGSETIINTLAIKEWFEEFDFLHRVFEEEPHAREIWEKAAKLIELEAEVVQS